MKPALSRFALAGLLATASLLAACGGGEETTERECKMRVTRGALALGTLCLDAEAEQTFEVENFGSGPCEVGLELAGQSPQYFELSATQLTVAVGELAPVTVKYHPTAAAGAAPGEQHFALVKVTSDANVDGSYDLSVDGQTAATETKAILSLSCPPSVKKCGPSVDPSESCCRVVDQSGNDGPPYYGRSYLTQVEFGAVQTGRTVTVPLEVTNLGCGTLDVSALTFNPTVEPGFCDASSVSVVTPLPVQVAGSVSAQTRQKATIEVQFTPTTLCNYVASVTVATNDPDIVNYPNYGTFQAVGAGTEGRIRTDPTAWYFQDIAVGASAEKTFTVVNVGTRAAEVSAVSLRSGAGVYQITKIERPNCPAGSTPVPLTVPFTLAATDQVSNCGDDQANVTVTFTPNGAGRFENTLDVNYGDGVAAIPLSGDSNPQIEAIPGSQILFFGPKVQGCQPLSCTVGDMPNASCDGVCANDGDCDAGVPCIGGVCAANNEAACTDTCGDTDRTIRICNAGHAPLKFDDAAQGGGLVITGNGGRDNPPPMHVPMPGIDDPARNNTPVFSIVSNGCADTAGNGKTLQPAECCEASIHFLDTRNGGSLTGTSGLQAELHIYTNDPSYSRELADGLGLEIRAWTDPDFDPVAKWVAYDQALGWGELNGPRMGRMAVLDAGPLPGVERSGSYDPTCDWNDPNCNRDLVNPIVSYEWELVAVSGVGDYVNAMVGPIDLDNPNGRCPPFINGGNCFEVVDLGAQTGRVIRFFPDGDAPRNYEFRLKVTDGVCSPPHQGILQQSIQVGAGN